MASEQVRPYGGVSGEQRRAKRRAALLDAGLDMLAADGAAGVTVRGVCGRARLNDRYFYESFADRDELLVALLDELAGSFTTATLGELADAPPDAPTRLRSVLTAVLRLLTEDPRRGRLLVESQATEGLRRRRHEAVGLLASIMATQARELLGDRAPSALDTELGALTLVSGGLELVVSWLRGELTVDQAHLVDFLVALILTAENLAVALDQQRPGDPGGPAGAGGP